MRQSSPLLLASAALLLMGLLPALLLFARQSAHADPGVLYAAPSPQGSGDCSSWANACRLQTALSNAVSGDEIWVRQGVHYPTTNPSDRAAAFALRNGVALYGGFVGTETQREQRDWQNNLTILSGDIDQNDLNADGDFIAETWNDIQGANSYHVVAANGVDNSAVLDGFVVTAGQANASTTPNDRGGGIDNRSGNPVLRNLIVNGNYAASYGGGLYSDHSSASLSHVTFSGNRAVSYGGGMYNRSGSPSLTEVVFDANSGANGGGMGNELQSNPSLTDVVFSNNSATNGGGLYNYYSSNPTLTNVTFSNNVANYNGGGMTSSTNSTPVLTDVIFDHNTANQTGGGMSNASNSTPALTNVIFSNNTAAQNSGGMRNDASSPTLVNVTFVNNTAGQYGGGIGNYNNSAPRLTNVIFYNCAANNGGGGMYNNASSPTLTNVTFNNNSAPNAFGGGIMNANNSNPALANVILWGDSAFDWHEIYNSSSRPVISYSDIQGCGGSGSWNNACGNNGGGNIDSDPRFVDAAGGDLRPSADSPVIDAGNNAAVPSGVTVDLDGKPRFLDVPAIPDTGNGTPPIVDMGAYEYERRIFYAAETAQGNGDCLSWANACLLRTALAQAQLGDEIWVRRGVHYPTSNPADRTATFALKNGVGLYGGFAGTETQRELRDWQNNPTILSGDIDQNDLNADGDFIAETWNDIQGANSYHVVSASWVDNSAALDGFIVTAGQANGSGAPSNSGGGLYNSWSNPTLSNITFSGNLAAQLGGGIYNDYSRPSLSNDVFSGNYASFGGGMYNNYFSPTLTNVAFSNNSAAQRGGGLYNVSGSPSLTGVTFSANSALYGGGMYNDYGNPTLTGAVFSANTAIGANGANGADGGGNGEPGGNAYGAGLYNSSGDITISDSRFEDNLARGGIGGTGDASTATYCYRDFWGSWHCTPGHPAGNGGVGGNGYGGAIYGAAGSLTLSNVVFEDNRAEGGSGGLGGNGSSSLSGDDWYTSGFPGGDGGAGGLGYGGAIYSAGALNLNSNTFLQNLGTGGQGGRGGGNGYGGPGDGGAGGHGYGGGLYSQGATNLINADFSLNVGAGGNGGDGGSSYYGTGRGGDAGSGYGAAIYSGAGSVNATNLAMSRNSATPGVQGAGNPYGNPGLRYGGGIANAASAISVINATIASNMGGYGGGLYNQSGTLTLTNTIVAHNTGYAGHQNCSGSVTSGGYNLDSGSTCNLAQPGDLANTDPLLLDAANGNLRLRLASPAIDAGDNAALPPGVVADLDGNPRFADIPTIPDTGSGTPPIVDMGAYETRFADAALSKAVSPASAAPGEAITFTLRLSTSGSLPLAGILVTDTLPAFLQNAAYASSLVITDTSALPPYVWEVQPLLPGESGVITVTGVLSIPLAAGVYTNTTVLAAEGDLLAANNTAVVTYTVRNVAPRFTSAPLTSATQYAPYTYAITTEDDNGDALIITAPTLPAWLTLQDHGDGTATLSGTPTDVEVGEHPVVVRVTDQGGLFAEQSFTITVANLNDAPYFTSTPVVSATQDITYTYAIAASDPDLIHGDALAITAPTLPAWLTLQDHGDGSATLSGTPDNADVGEHQVILRVSDQGGLFAEQSFTITVANLNDAPYFTSTPVVSAEPNAVYTYTVVTTDPDLIHGEALFITAPTLPAWLTLQDHGDGTATLTGTPGNADVGEFPVLLRVTDQGGLSAEQSFTIAVGSRLYLPLIIRDPTELTGAQIAPGSVSVSHRKVIIRRL